jgi:hypothetical protein
MAGSLQVNNSKIEGDNPITTTVLPGKLAEVIKVMKTFKMFTLFVINQLAS